MLFCCRSGLLYRHVPRPRQNHAKADHILQRNARFHIDLSHVQKILEEESPRHQGKINIALHIGNNQSYEKVNSSQLTVYQHFNTLHNYFLVMNKTILAAGSTSSTTTTITTTTTTTSLTSLSTNASLLSAAYTSAVRVLLYQHEWGGYGCRDCVKLLAQAAGLPIPDSPLTTAYRQEWDKSTVKRKQRYKILYGSLSFGVCEKILKPCNYFVMMPHPIDRILQVYHYCKQGYNRTTNFCHFDKLNFTNLTLSQFIRNQGSGFFKKLLYYSRHCRLVGDDEVCLKDAAFSFSSIERQVLLNHILDNLHKWFSVVGLVNRYNESMELFEYVYKQNFTSCPLPEFEDKSEDYIALYKRIEKDKLAMKYLHADIAIYNRLEEIFQQQLEIYRDLTRTSDMTASSGLSTTSSIPVQRARFVRKNITHAESHSVHASRNRRIKIAKEYHKRHNLTTKTRKAKEYHKKHDLTPKSHGKH